MNMKCKTLKTGFDKQVEQDLRSYNFFMLNSQEREI